ncbi:Nucleoside-diphosphate-sugar epimerase [Amycolatopsis marina]|uniref:Nucleoside-diphosphate-sugar epimerase n=1 Tax=Amycolatopsis marina TaxID=490629 RepID=A0A1I0XZ41_9PSEU|nr:NAD-dependent epimerase/dehydratase family protein [Amycolatopsis marina]SFB06275.1 Nucleoside-diphosphate-sugar epimerase [Amycolatopsis marina]
MSGIRVVVTGATGNVGTSVVEALSEDERVESITGLARRSTQWSRPKLHMSTVDLGTVPDGRLDRLLTGADVVIHLAWLFQPTRDPAVTWRTNVLGSIRVFEAAARSGVKSVVYASSVGAYSPGPQDTRVDETWPTHGWPGAAYTREKAYLERFLDGFERSHPDLRVVRMRPGFIFKRESASEQRRLFAGPLLPGPLAHPALLPVIPELPGLRFQALHSSDVADAYRRAALSDVRGAFNLAAEPVVDARSLAGLLHARPISMPAWPVRAAVAAAWRLHAIPAAPGLFDAVLRLPLMDTSRARTELDWAPRFTALDALAEFLKGLREKAGMATPPLAPSVRGGRLHELRTGVGSRP